MRSQELLIRLNKTVDKLSYRIDPKIKPVLYLLWEMNIKTNASCEGHHQSGLPYPWFDCPGTETVYDFGLHAIIYASFVRYHSFDISKSLPQMRMDMLRKIKQYHKEPKPLILLSRMS